MSGTNHYGKIAKRLPDLVATAQKDTAGAALAAMAASMATSKHGVQYPDLPNRSSAPGEAPATQDPDGGLAAGLGSVPLPDGDRAVTSSAPYAAELEYGRIDGRVAPRPWMVPAVRAAVPAHLKRLGKLLPEAARGR